MRGSVRLGLGLGAISASNAEEAHAFEVEECPSGDLIGHMDSAHAFEVDTCDTPMNSAEFEVLQHGQQAWDTIQGAYDRFSLVEGDADCTMAGGGRWETAVVPDTHPLLDWAVGGRAVVRTRGCAWPYHGQLHSADVVIWDALAQDPLDELDSRIGARETAIHEYGHVLGALHEDDVMSAACSAGCGKVGRRGLTDLGDRAESVLPDDAEFMFTYYDSGSDGNHDAAPSPWTHAATGAELIYGANAVNGNTIIYGQAGTDWDVCPGAIRIFRYGLANLGKKSFESSDPLQVEIVFSTNRTISIHDVPMGARNLLSVSRGEFQDVKTLLVVPLTLTPGKTYHVGLIADPDDDFVEDDEFNNASESGLRLRIKTTGC